MQLVPYDLAGQRTTSGESDGRSLGSLHGTSLAAAGIAVVAQDTGRCLLIQRSNKDPDDPARGTWEFPGGKCEQGETAFVCAQREWQEEMGQKLPPGAVAGQWTSANGIYRCYVWLIAREDQISLTNRTAVKNPDDPDHDDIEAFVWWNVEDLYGMPALRIELRDQADWTLLRSFAKSKDALKELDQLGNWLRHKKPVEKFEPRRLPEAEFQRIKTALRRTPPGQVLAASRSRLLAKAAPPATATRAMRKRDLALRGVMARLAAQLGQLARKDPKSLPTTGTRLLQNAYAAAYLAGKKAFVARKAADIEDDGWDELPDDVQSELQPKVDKQSEWLGDLAKQIALGLALSALADTFDNYAETTIGVYESGYQDGAQDALQQDGGGGIQATWVVTAEDPCPLCEEKNGQTWPIDEAPLPGDGDFGEICEGAYHCRCVLEYSWIGADDQSEAA